MQVHFSNQANSYQLKPITITIFYVQPFVGSSFLAIKPIIYRVLFIGRNMAFVHLSAHFIAHLPHFKYTVNYDFLFLSHSLSLSLALN